VPKADIQVLLIGVLIEKIKPSNMTLFY